MKTVRLGKTDLEISRVGIGGIPLMRPPEAEAIRVVQRALDLGVTFVDTALGYTDSEIRVGKAVAGRLAGPGVHPAQHQVVLARSAASRAVVHRICAGLWDRPRWSAYEPGSRPRSRRSIDARGREASTDGWQSAPRRASSLVSYTCC